MRPKCGRKSGNGFIFKKIPMKLYAELNTVYIIGTSMYYYTASVIVRWNRHRTIHFYLMCTLFFRTKIVFTLKSWKINERNLLANTYIQISVIYLIKVNYTSYHRVIVHRNALCWYTEKPFANHMWLLKSFSAWTLYDLTRFLTYQLKCIKVLI